MCIRDRRRSVAISTDGPFTFPRCDSLRETADDNTDDFGLRRVWSHYIERAASRRLGMPAHLRLRRSRQPGATHGAASLRALHEVSHAGGATRAPHVARRPALRALPSAVAPRCRFYVRRRSRLARLAGALRMNVSVTGRVFLAEQLFAKIALLGKPIRKRKARANSTRAPLDLGPNHLLWGTKHPCT